jgi:hypothetical protein
VGRKAALDRHSTPVAGVGELNNDLLYRRSGIGAWFCRLLNAGISADDGGRELRHPLRSMSVLHVVPHGAAAPLFSHAVLVVRWTQPPRSTGGQAEQPSEAA